MGWLARALCSLALAAAVLLSTSELSFADEPSTIYVLTRPEIASLGARSLPDVLRAMPGIRVTGTGERDWAVIATGRGDSPEGRLLVLIDGRQIEGAAVRPPSYAQAPVLGEIDRIELIRGRAAALWGKSASNGVIHIITTKARYTQGVLRPHRGG
ncbi:MAG TPA: TonB-dependent receptor plug domain-containing protein [Myxococcota bacterium]|nr:TonB-dependent receptor plug domain-containing protein [Myxococcota bacterium]